jgi:protein disulfide-isomerase A3
MNLSKSHSELKNDGHVNIINSFIMIFLLPPLNSHGLVGLRVKDTVSDFKVPLIVAYYAVDYVKNPKGTNYWRNRVLKVAKEWKGKFNFGISPKDEFQHEINEYGYDYVGDKPLILARDARNQKFIMKDDFS